MNRRGFMAVGTASAASLAFALPRAEEKNVESVGENMGSHIDSAAAKTSKARFAAASASHSGLYSASETLNLKDVPYSAQGDGVTDDTAAVQAWLNDVVANQKTGVVPPGNYLLTSTITAPQGGYWRIIGHGRYASAFFYASSQTNANIFQIGSTSLNSNAIQIRGISIFSLYTMTGGFALKANRLANSSIVDVTFGGELYGNYTANGLWLNGAHQVFVSEFDFQTLGDGLRVNGLDLQSCSDLYLDQGFSTNNGVCGVRCAGGFGGLYLDGVETLANGFANLIIDNSQPTATGDGNREIILGTSYIADGVHTVSEYGIYIDDPAASNATVVCHGFIGSSKLHGVYIKTWPGSSFNMGAGRIFNNLQDGVRIEDPSAHVVIGDGVSIDNNVGWGVRALGGNERTHVAAHFYNNAGGDISEGVGGWWHLTPQTWPQQGDFVANCQVRWMARGKTIDFSGQVFIQSNGTGRGAVLVALPVPALPGTVAICSGRADAVSGKMLQGVIRGNSLALVNYDNSYPGQNGERLWFSGSYEASYLKKPAST